MRITDLLKSTAIELNVSVASKDEAIDKLIALHEKAGNLKDAAKFKEEILKREGHSSTAIGEGIAVPHAKSAAVKAPALALITVPSGIDYGAPDGKPSDLLFMIAATEDGDVHLEILSRLMVIRIADADFVCAVIVILAVDCYGFLAAERTADCTCNVNFDFFNRYTGFNLLGCGVCTDLIKASVRKQISRFCLKGDGTFTAV